MVIKRRPPPRRRVSTRPSQRGSAAALTGRPVPRPQGRPFTGPPPSSRPTSVGTPPVRFNSAAPSATLMRRQAGAPANTPSAQQVQTWRKDNRCVICGSPSHWARECPHRQNNKARAYCLDTACGQFADMFPDMKEHILAFHQSIAEHLPEEAQEDEGADPPPNSLFQ